MRKMHSGGISQLNQNVLMQSTLLPLTWTTWAISECIPFLTCTQSLNDGDEHLCSIWLPLAVFSNCCAFSHNFMKSLYVKTWKTSHQVAAAALVFIISSLPPVETVACGGFHLFLHENCISHLQLEQNFSNFYARCISALICLEGHFCKFFCVVHIERQK